MNDSYFAAKSEQFSVFDEPNYATLLRPIGQMLDKLRIDSFAVRPDEDGFVVRDQTRNRVQITPRERAFLEELNRSHADSIDKTDILSLEAGILEWRVKPEDIERFEHEGRAQRRAPNQTPDAHSAAHVLRVAGSILDHRGGQVTSLLKDEQGVTLAYDLPGGRTAAEQYDMPMLYDFWVRMYMKRGTRYREARLTAE